jgi:hypothetical protein
MCVADGDLREDLSYHLNLPSFRLQTGPLHFAQKKIKSGRWVGAVPQERSRGRMIGATVIILDLSSAVGSIFASLPCILLMIGSNSNLAIGDLLNQRYLSCTTRGCFQALGNLTEVVFTNAFNPTLCGADVCIFENYKV